jgi:glycosyltransferase involved in cell wall biosynthesis
MIPQKVAFFLPHFGHGGAEGVVFSLLKGMDRTRHKPVIVLQQRRGELLDRVPEDVQVLALNRPKLPGCIPELANLFTREEISLVVTLTNVCSLYSVPASRLAKSQVATLVTEHTPLNSFLAEAKLRHLRKAAIRLVYPYATLTGGPIEEIGGELSDLLSTAAPPYVYLPNPVVEKVGALRTPSQTGRQVVSVGRLAPEKRFDLLIDAFAMMHQQMPDARLTIYGEGAERPALEAQVKRLGLDGAVDLPGYTSDLDAVHSAADLFVCTSRREGLGNAIIEAMARGVPVVSVDCPFGPKRLLRDGLVGRLVHDHSPAAVAEAMGVVLADHAMRLGFAKAGLEVARDYETTLAVAAYQTAFDRAIASKSTGGQSEAFPPLE